MEKYKYFEHTADTKFQAYGKTREEAFSNAALAMFNVITDTNKIKPKIKKGIVGKGHDLKSLLYNFLEEFLFLLDTEHFLLNKVQDIFFENKGKELHVCATVLGDTFKDQYETSGDIKAITYNDMEIIEKEDKVTLQVVLDL